MRQAILACLFSAMRNGTDFVLPKISLQDPMKLQVTGDIVVSMDHLFDTAILRARLSEDCPEMTVHDELSTVNAENVEIQDFDPSGQQES